MNHGDLNTCVWNFLRSCGLNLLSQYISETYPNVIEWNDLYDVSEARHADFFSACWFGFRLMYRLLFNQDYSADFNQDRSFFNHPLTAGVTMEPGHIYFIHSHTEYEVHYFTVFVFGDQGAAHTVDWHAMYVGTYGGNLQFYAKPVQLHQLYQLLTPGEAAASAYQNIFDVPPDLTYRAYYTNICIEYDVIPIRDHERGYLSMNTIIELITDLLAKAIHPRNKRELEELLYSAQSMSRDGC